MSERTEEEQRASEIQALRPGQRLEVTVSKVTAGRDAVWLTVVYRAARGTLRYPLPPQEE